MHMNMKFVPVPPDNSDRSVTCPNFHFLAFSPVLDGRTKLQVEPCINIDLLNFKHEQVLKYMTTFLSHKFLLYISLPTCITHHSATCIDHNFTKCPQSLNNIDISSGILFCDISDHLPCFMSVAVDGKNDKRPLTRLFWNVQCQTFNNHMNNFIWEEIYTPTGDWYSAFIEKVKYFYNISFPLVQISRARIKDKPWITTGLKQSIRTKNRLYRDSIRKSKLNYNNNLDMSITTRGPKIAQP